MHHRAMRQLATEIIARVAHELLANSSRRWVEPIGIAGNKPREHQLHQCLAARAIFVRASVQPRERRKKRRVPQRPVQFDKFVDACFCFGERASLDLVALATSREVFEPKCCCRLWLLDQQQSRPPIRERFDHDRLQVPNRHEAKAELDLNQIIHPEIDKP